MRASSAFSFCALCFFVDAGVAHADSGDLARFVVGGVIDQCPNPDGRGVALPRYTVDEKTEKLVNSTAPMPVCPAYTRPWYFGSYVVDAAWMSQHNDKAATYNRWDLPAGDVEKAFTKAFGVPLYKKKRIWEKPESSLNIDSYNPAAVDAIMKVLYVAPSDGKLGASAQLLYDVGFKDMVRETASEVGRYTQTKGWLAAKTERAKKMLATPNSYLRGSYDAWANELPAAKPADGEEAYGDGGLVGTLIRRSLDGTLPPMLTAFGRALKDYDPETYAVWSKNGYAVNDGKVSVDLDLDAPPGINWIGVDVDDGKQNGGIPGSLRLSPGKHKLTLKLQDAAGVADVVQTLEVPPAKPVVIKVRDGKARVVVEVEGDVDGTYKVGGVDQYVPGVVEVAPGAAVAFEPEGTMGDCQMLPPQKLTLAADEVKKLKVKPTKAVATLHVDAAKSGFVIVDGKDVGKTGADIVVSACARQLQVLVDGKKIHEQALALAPASKTTLMAGAPPPKPATPSPVTPSPFTAVAPPTLPATLSAIKLPNSDGPIDYSVTADVYAARGNTVKVECPAQIKLGKVYGSGPYAVTSSICFAAVHAGLLQRGQAGALAFTIGPVADVKGSRENGVTSLDLAGQKTFAFVP